MISEEVKLDYENKSREELRLSISFARNARRELNRGNFKVAMTQAMEAEKHIVEVKGLIRNIYQLAEMDRANSGKKREIRFEEEFKEQNKQLEDLELQLANVKSAAAKESAPGTAGEKDEEYEIKV